MSRIKSTVVSCDVAYEIDYFKYIYEVYLTRLKCMSKILTSNIKSLYDADIVIHNISDLVFDERCIVIGIIFKESDQILFDDCQKRIQLSPDSIDKSKFVTGVVLALLGVKSGTEQGVFIVEDIVYPTPSYPLIKNPSGIEFAPYIALISGIELDDNADVAITLRLALDWLCGQLVIGQVPIDPRTIGRLIIAGNSVFDTYRDNADTMDVVEQAENNPMQVLDLLFNDAAPSLPIDIMPGPHDLRSETFPQTPFLKFSFPKASQWSTIQRRSNPWQFTLDNGRLAIGTAGQNIDDILKDCDIQDPLDRLRASVKWGHIAPTAPSSLITYPNVNDLDPLVMAHRPYLYFAGNQDKFQWHEDVDDGGSTVFVTVPRFKDTGSIVLVNIVDNTCTCISFK